ncbi:Endonuclease III-like protein [Emericellopsis cladophorae]|uniref:Endonuclease III homolog n=1 Tax=Emericellopsis cladophorae TaxID=2686198 RepID=A0A9P9Y4V2_9HYPO|nr:Endonuclease III-like protein [Emericellopsis cladophorae]KAI6783521.1 Endonuclease III-like protein [Emericellopsis cladophorae]
MRTSRASRDASKLFGRGSPSPPRRTTRSSLARFAYGTPSTTTDDNATPDVEDAIPTPARKRRRLTATSTVKTSPSSTSVKVNVEDVKEEQETKSPVKRARKPARKTTAPNGETTVSSPSDWEEMFEVVRTMRAPGGAAANAAVDTMGCERLADTNASPRDQRFHTLIALMLSSQTKDTVNAVAMARLKTELPPWKEGEPFGLNLENVLAVEPDVLNKMIWAVGFHNNKTKYIKQTAEILRDRFAGDIPDTIEGLVSLPGVGPKMGYLCLSAAWDRTEGIGVDVHVHRITNLWGWNKTNSPEATRASLESWLPQNKWRDINHMLVGLGQTICLPQGRKCGECDLGLRGLCKAAERKKVAEGRRVKEERLEQEGDTIKVGTQLKEEIAVKEEVVCEDVKIKLDGEAPDAT